MKHIQSEWTTPKGASIFDVEKMKKAFVGCEFLIVIAIIGVLLPLGLWAARTLDWHPATSLLFVIIGYFLFLLFLNILNIWDVLTEKLKKGKVKGSDYKVGTDQKNK